MATATKKKGRGKKALIVILAIIIVIAIIFGVCYGIGQIGYKSNTDYAKNVKAVDYTNQLKPTLDKETGYWTFTTDKEFKILQLTDIHIGGGFISLERDAWALQACEKLIRETKPDLVVVSGDIGWPIPYSSGTVNNLRPVIEFTNLMESLGVYWTFVFGNHDTEVYSFYDRKYISDYYDKKIQEGELKYCLYQSGFQGEIEGYEGIEADAGYGNTMILVKNSSGAIVQDIILIDSHSYEKGFFQDYDHIHECQIDWYKDEIAKLTDINKKATGSSKVIKSIAFFHIPLEEYKTAWEEYLANDKANTDNVKLVYGSVGESGKMVYCGVSPDNFFETIQEVGSTRGIFCGHDHLNNYSLYYNGGKGDNFIKLTYGMSIDYIAYFGIASKTAQRGGTVITINTDGTFDNFGLRLSDLGILE